MFSAEGQTDLGCGKLDQTFDDARIRGEGRDQGKEMVLLVRSKSVPDHANSILHILWKMV